MSMKSRISEVADKMVAPHLPSDETTVTTNNVPDSDGAVFRVLGVRVHAVQIPDALATMERWIEQRERCHYVSATGMHGVSEALHDPAFKVILNSADLVVPDGMPLVWIGRLRGIRRLQRRVYGPELMLEFCKQTARKKYRHFFFGGAPVFRRSSPRSFRRSV